jgi:hypothetical protein
MKERVRVNEFVRFFGVFRQGDQGDRLSVGARQPGGGVKVERPQRSEDERP